MVDFVKAGADGAIERHRALEARVRALEAMFQMPGGGGYASLTGPGETATPGDLTQAGGLTVDDTAGDGILLSSTGGPGGISLLELDLAGGISLQTQAGALATGVISIQGEGTGGINIRTGVGAGDIVVDSANGNVYLTSTPTGEIVLNSHTLGFFNATSVAQPATPVTLGDVIAALQALGLVA